MKQDEIIEMARQAGMFTHKEVQLELQTFAKLVAAKERESWRNAAIRVGENLATCGPTGYYDFTAQHWLDWALDAITKMQDDYMNLGACGEREACAKVCEDLDAHRQVATWYSQAIRARGEA